MATLDVRVLEDEFVHCDGAETASLRHECARLDGVAHYLGKIALLVATIVCLVSAASEANATCSHKSFENLPPLTKSDAMPMTVVFEHSDFSSEAISRFEKEMAIINPRILEVAREVKILTFDKDAEVKQIYLRETGMVAVIDPQFMKEGKPKYNSLLRSFRDTTIEEDQILILDPWPIGETQPTAKPDRAFIQITSTIKPELLPYLLELAAYLWYDSSLFSTPEFAKYVSLVSDEAADGGSLNPSTLEMREAVIVNCLDVKL
jgi:hypothetical protein